MEETYTDEYGVVFSADRKKLISVPKGLKEYVIPEGTTIIGRKAFYEASMTLESIHIPNSVQRIDDFAFYSIKKIKSLTIPDSVQSIGYYAFLTIEDVTYNGNAKTGYPWGAKRINGKNSEKEKKTQEVSFLPWDGGLYFGTVVNGIPNGRGTLCDNYGRSPKFDGLWENGKPVSGDIFDELGRNHNYGGPTPENGYGSGFHNGEYYTGKWVNGYPEEEWDELWHEIN